MMHAIFSQRAPQVMHAVKVGESQTVCKRPLGRGSGLVRDGSYGTGTPCVRCWSKP